MTEVKRVEVPPSTTTPPAPAKRSGAEREAETTTSFAPLVDGIPIPCPVRSEASARRTIPRESPTRGGTEPAPYRPAENTLKTTPPSHPPGDGFQRKGPRALPLVVSRGSRGEIPKSPRESFLGSARGYSFDWKRIPPRKPPIFIGTIAPARRAGPPRPQPGARCRQASLAPRLLNRPPAAGCGHPALRSAGRTIPAPAWGQKKRAPASAGAPSQRDHSGFTRAMCSSSSCFCVTSLGALIITSWAFLFMGKGMISRMESSPASSITMRSTPGAMPAWGGAP